MSLSPSHSAPPPFRNNRQSNELQKDKTNRRVHSHSSSGNAIIKYAAESVKTLTSDVRTALTDWWQGGPLPPPPPPSVLRPNEISIEVETFVVYDKPIEGGFIEVAFVEELEAQKKPPKKSRSKVKSKDKWVLLSIDEE